MDINTCYELTKDLHTVAYYSHLIPAAIILALSLFVLVQTKFSLMAKLFSSFGILLSLWLIGDVVLWTVSDYNIVSFAWAPLDYINILFYLFGTYFFIVLVKGKDIGLWSKFALFALSLPPWYLTVTNQSVMIFDQTVCEAINNPFLTNYKLVIEGITILIITGVAIYNYRFNTKEKRQQIIWVMTGLLAFFLTFSSTEYIASITGVYEISLYSLFVLPLFLGGIIYSITSFQMFQLKTFGTQLLIYILLIMIGSQFFFLESTTDKNLTIITFGLSVIFAYFLLRAARREINARKKVESLAADLERANVKLKSLDKLKTEFLSLASHQLRSPLTAIKGYASMLDERAYGTLEPKQEEAVRRIYASAQGLSSLVEDLLNISKIEQGGMKYEMMSTELGPIVESLYNDMKIPASNKGLEFTLDIAQESNLVATVDPMKMRQVFLNLVDNAIKYTPSGFVKIALKRKDNTILFSVTDSGVGVTNETKTTLFEKFTRGEGGKLNTSGSGLGLYLALEIAKAHKGNISIESAGQDKGSVFTVEIPAE